MLRIVITSSAFPMSFGSTCRLVNLSGICADAPVATKARPYATSAMRAGRGSMDHLRDEHRERADRGGGGRGSSSSGNGQDGVRGRQTLEAARVVRPARR